MADKLCIVKNRSAGTVSYRIPEDGVRRLFQPGEPKKIMASELERLCYQPGGRELIMNYLQVDDAEVLDNLNVPIEREYWMSEAQIKDLLVNGSLDAFLDALDFAPSGVMDLIKKFAVELPLNDNAKREALKKATGFDVTKALLHKQEEQEGVEEQTEAPKRRVQPEAAASGRRTNNNYKIVNKQE